MRVLVSIAPPVKEAANAICQRDQRIGSFSRLMEFALKYYVAQYKAAGENIDDNGAPVMASNKSGDDDDPIKSPFGHASSPTPRPPASLPQSRAGRR